LLLQQQFFQSFLQKQQNDTCGDIATVEISNLLLDDVPDADPRWAENQCQGYYSYIYMYVCMYVYCGCVGGWVRACMRAWSAWSV